MSSHTSIFFIDNNPCGGRGGTRFAFFGIAHRFLESRQPSCSWNHTSIFFCAKSVILSLLPRGVPLDNMIRVYWSNSSPDNYDSVPAFSQNSGILVDLGITVGCEYRLIGIRAHRSCVAILSHCRGLRRKRNPAGASFRKIIRSKRFAFLASSCHF